MAKVHTVAEGETLLDICKKYGFNNWRTIYDLPENAAINHEKTPELRLSRPNPNQLKAGDKVTIPDRIAAQFDRRTDETHVFLRRTLPQDIPMFLCIRCERDGTPYANTPYKLDVEGTMIQATTDDNGEVRQKVKSTAKKAKLTLYVDRAESRQPLTWEIALVASSDEMKDADAKSGKTMVDMKGS
ncbi:MAG: LysM domain-containing protein [Planctomycetota bacterium]|nr:LysM domain-containing protein [Planctomycetota bacterium]